MVQLTILRDTREQKPWSFDGLPVETRDETLRTGDYTLEEFCDYDAENDTYIPNYAIERKEGSDFVSSITTNMDRFQKEIRRASDWPCPLLVIVEEPKNPSRYHNDYFLKYFENIDRSQVFSTVDTLERNYNVSFKFAGNRSQAQRTAHETLSSRLRSFLTSGY